MIYRIYVEKKPGYDVEAHTLMKDFKENLGIHSLQKLRILNRYDVSGISQEEWEKSKTTIFSNPPVDELYDEHFDFSSADKVLAVASTPGQYDQRTDAATEALKLLCGHERPQVSFAKVILLYGDIDDTQFKLIKDYYINPLELSEVPLEKPKTLHNKPHAPGDLYYVQGFTTFSSFELEKLLEEESLAMSLEDLLMCQEYFRDTEKRDPTITELRVIDTYWSDHCRHTTFMTSLDNIEIQEGPYSDMIKAAFSEYLRSREKVYGNKPRDITLMDLATINMKELKADGLLEDLEISEEVNACSIVVNAEIDGKIEEWLVMFKNETHNHPTEMEPFGGASTCLGGAIRDPLSGRSYVYGAMRISGSGDPRQRIEDTLPGKLPQRTITTKAAQGYSSYGNQIGVAAGQVVELYDPGFIAKRMELGAVIAAAPKVNVIRKSPAAGDVVLLVGGRTGRDGCGGATGSSREHHEDSLMESSAEVQKGNPLIERNIQRLFRKPNVSRLIKKCNDFGAGGVSVAVGELAPGLFIDLDAVPVKYEGLDATELAISESQERMAVVVAPEDVEKFIQHALEENLEATPIAKVTDDRRLVMMWKGKRAMDISRDFLDTHGARRYATVQVSSPKGGHAYEDAIKAMGEEKLQELWVKNLQDLNVCSQQGLVEAFDSTVGALTVLSPLGGKYQVTPQQGLAMKLPVLQGETNTATIMTYGYNPKICRWSPFHGGMYAVVEAVSKAVALGGNYSSIRLTMQEYFERLGEDPERWGKPFSALLGAYHAQKNLGIAAIGGKDSMSGTFMDLDVPPTLVAFAVDCLSADKIVSREIKAADSYVLLLGPDAGPIGELDFEKMKLSFDAVQKLIGKGYVLSASAISHGGIAATISEMCFGNKIGFVFEDVETFEDLFLPKIGQILLEVKADADFEKELSGVPYRKLGTTQQRPHIEVNGLKFNLDYLQNMWEHPLEKVFPIRVSCSPSPAGDIPVKVNKTMRKSSPIARPKVFIPVFPGTHGEYETTRAFEKAGAVVETFVVQNRTPSLLRESLERMAQYISSSQILAIASGASLGDEPDGAGKYIAAAFRAPQIQEAIMKLLDRDGLILGIGNGFHALILLGLLPYGEIRDPSEDSPALVFNDLGRSISKLVRTKVVSPLSPWFLEEELGCVKTLPISHGQGKFVASENLMKELMEKGQIATQYVDFQGKPSMDPVHNPYGSIYAVEGITSPDGRILGRMAHPERMGADLNVNVSKDKAPRIFEAGVQYFTR